MSNFYDFHQIVNRKRQSVYEEETRRRAVLRDVFLSQDNELIVRLLKLDLKRYLDDDDIAQIFPVTLDRLIPSFLESIIQVHKKPIIFRFEEGVDDKDKEAFYELMDEVKLHLILQDTDLKMRFHNTIMVAARYYEELDKLYLDNNFNAGTCRVIPYPDYELEPMIVWRMYYDASEKERYLVWDARDKDHYVMFKEPKYDPETRQITGNKVRRFEGEQGVEVITNGDPGQTYFPFVTYRYKDQNYGYWQNGMDSIIEINRIMNVLFTIMGEDSARETLRILIFPWEVEGNKGETKNRIKVGLSNPIYKPQVGEQAADSAQIVSAELYNSQIIELIDKIIEIVSGLENIASKFKADIERNLSGIAIRLKNEPILNQWSKDINIVRAYDWHVIKKVVEVNEYHRKGKTKSGAKLDIKILDKLVLDYQEPQINFDDKETYALERMKWEDGVSNPVEWLQRRNPEWDEKTCIEFIKKNKEQYEELFGVGLKNFTPVKIEDQLDIINQ